MKYKVKVNTKEDVETVLEKALAAHKAQSIYPLRDSYLKGLQNHCSSLFFIVLNEMGKEIEEVLNE